MPIMFMAVVQVIVFFIIIYGFNVSELSNNVYDLLDKTVSMKSSFFQRDLNSLIGNVKLYHEVISENINKIAGEKGLDLKDVIYEEETYSVLEDNLTDVLSLSRSSMVTGGYVILENNKTRKSAIYIRSISPDLITTDNSDLLAEAGRAEILKDKGISLDTNWSPGLEIDDSEKYNFYNIPFQAGNYYKNISASELGYWSDVHNFNGVDVITYSIPLVDKGHNSYGVLGIEISLDYISKILPEAELEFGNSSSYMIVKSDNNNRNFKKEFIGKKLWNEISVSNENFNIKKQNDKYSLYSINDKALNKDVYCIIKPLEMYKSNTPFEEDLWYLAVAVEEQELFEGIYKLKELFFKSIIVIALISLITALFVSSYFTKPIQNLMNELRNSDPSEQLSLKNTNILEIDELSAVIERLNKDVAYSASRFTQMIDLVDISIGGIEYDEELGICHLTGNVCEMMDFSESYYLAASNKKDFLKEFDDFRKKVVNITQASENKEIYTCEVNKNNGEIVWLRFSIKKEVTRQIIVLIDVTEEILDMKRVEYERDHDSLTGLLNRVAFERKSKKLLNEKPKAAAMIMWDLDNLKYINDNYGHELGDEYIIKTAAVLRGIERAGALVSRRSGDEFFAMIYGLKSEEEIYKEICRVHEELLNTELKLADDKNIKIKASCGYVCYPEETGNIENLIKYADFAMYEAKKNKKGTIRKFNLEEYKKSEVDMEFE